LFFVAIAASSCPVSSFPPRRGPHRPTGAPVRRGTVQWCQAMMVVAVTPSAHLVKPYRRRLAHLGPASVFPLRSGAESDVRWACHTHLCHLPSPSARLRRQRDGITRPQLPPPPSHYPCRHCDGPPHHRGLLLPPSQRVVEVDAAATSVCGDGGRGGTGGRVRGRGTTAACPLTDAGKGRPRRGTPASCHTTDTGGR